VHLYLNLATDHTFLFRAPEVTRQKHVDPGDIAAALGKLEDIKRGDPRWLPRYSILGTSRGTFRSWCSETCRAPNPSSSS
jgi:hypothetical protein